MDLIRLWITISLAGILLGCTPTPQSSGTASDGAEAHTSQNSLDWPGSYKGTLPCADCPGIDTVVTLARDGTYKIHRRYREKSEQVYSESGTFSWKNNGITVVLGDSQYWVGENKITLLDQQGERITGPLAAHYVLTKLPPPGLTGTRWRLTELRCKAVPPTPRTAHIQLNEQEKRVTGSGGCNVISGSFEQSPPNRLRFGQMISTKMACMDGMDTEQAFLETLGQADSYTLTGEKLQLLRARMAPLATFEADHMP